MTFIFLYAGNDGIREEGVCRGRLCNDGNLLKTMQNDPLEREKLEGKKERLSSGVMSLSRGDVPMAHCRACSLWRDCQSWGHQWHGLVLLWWEHKGETIGVSNLFSYKV